MIIYQDIPTHSRWATDVDRASGGRLSSPAAATSLRGDHVLQNILDLLQQYDDLRSQDPVRGAFFKHAIAIYLYEATEFWLAKGNRAPKTEIPGANNGPRFTTGLIGSEQEPMVALRDVSRRVVGRCYALLETADREEIRQTVATRGVGLLNRQASEDAARVADSRNVMWLVNPADRLRFKLRFRGGLAHRMEQPHVGCDFDIVLLTTTPNESEGNDGLTHFVMDAGGRIYCGYDKMRAKAFNFFHSSLVAGQPALAAGMMRIDRGVVKLIRNASGHYAPGGHNMAMLLSRLTLYGVDLSRLLLERYDALGRFYRPQDVLAYNDWPPAEYAVSTAVARQLLS